MSKEKPREEIEHAIESGNLERLLVLSGMIHGHYCPFSALGVKGGARAMRELEASSTGMEDLIAIVETNNCFSDGIQLVTGCTFGNNALIYRDFGKTACTLVQRGGNGIRLSVRTERVMEYQTEESRALFEKVVVRREGTPKEEAEMQSLWRNFSFQVLGFPDEEVFDIREVRADLPALARIFESAVCSVCGESVMEPRARMREGKPVCLPCSGQEYYQLTGDGISVVERYDAS